MLRASPRSRAGRSDGSRSEPAIWSSAEDGARPGGSGRRVDRLHRGRVRQDRPRRHVGVGVAAARGTGGRDPGVGTHGRGARGPAAGPCRHRDDRRVRPHVSRTRRHDARAGSLGEAPRVRGDAGLGRRARLRRTRVAQRRDRRLLGRESIAAALPPRRRAKVLMVAGAAAGIAAVFRAPLTGIVFGLEVPYTQDLARRALLPALVAASTSYLTYVALLGTGRIFEVSGGAAFDLRDLLGGFVVGLLCGTLARVGAWAIAHAKHLAIPVAVRVAGAGVALFALALVSHAWFVHSAQSRIRLRGNRLGARHQTALGLLVALFFVRFAATWFTVAGGGVGGLFIPSSPKARSRGTSSKPSPTHPIAGLFPTVGIAAFLGAGYRTPLAGVSFVAEATGQPGFVVPALLAAAASQLVMGRWSFAPDQRDERRPNLIPLEQLTVETLMSPNPDTVTADRPLDECLIEMARDNRRWVPVLDDEPLLRAPRAHRHREDPTRPVVPAHRTRRRSHRRPIRALQRDRRKHRAHDPRARRRSRRDHRRRARQRASSRSATSPTSNASSTDSTPTRSRPRQASIATPSARSSAWRCQSPAARVTTTRSAPSACQASRCSASTDGEPVIERVGDRRRGHAEHAVGVGHPPHEPARSGSSGSPSSATARLPVIVGIGRPRSSASSRKRAIRCASWSAGIGMANQPSAPRRYAPVRRRSRHPR